MTPSARLDALCADTIAKFKPREKPMPEIGGSKLAGEFKTGLAQMRKGIDELKLDMAGAISEFSSEMANGREAVKRIRKEAADARAAFAEMLGNESAEPQSEPPKANGGG